MNLPNFLADRFFLYIWGDIKNLVEIISTIGYDKIFVNSSVSCIIVLLFSFTKISIIRFDNDRH